MFGVCLTINHHSMLLNHVTSASPIKGVEIASTVELAFVKVMFAVARHWILAV